MKNAIACILLFSLFIGISLKTKATHLIGGYFKYECVGSTSPNIVEYELSLFLYIDCGPSSNVIIEDAAITIFDGNTNIDVLNTTMPLQSDSIIPDDINNPCVVSSPNVCVKEEVYFTRLFLDVSRPHLITYQRCCRNASISNLMQPDFQGSTISINIPEFNTSSCNSSPSFNQFPPISLCSGFDVNLDLSASDPDGDSLVYSICAPFNYADRTNVRPVPANPPPYGTLPYLSPFTSANPMPASPALSIDPNTGKLSGVPTGIGQYVLGFCVEEYRNGSLIGVTRRDIQVNTGSCNPVIASVVQDQELFCDGLTVQFKNNTTANVNIQDYKWDFGDPNLLDDTSRLFEPIYTYQDTGLYTITLVANPDFPCRDTTTTDFRVYKKLSPVLETEGKICAQNNNITFVARGEIQDHADISWNFGSSANINSSTLDSVSNVQFTGSGNFPVELIVSQDGCSDTITQIVELFNNPTVNFSYQPNAGCYPLPVQFFNLSSIAGGANYKWEFGDGASSTAISPLHTYLDNGYYDVSLEIITTDKCLDTVSLKIDSAVYVSLDLSTNELLFDYFPKEGCPGTTVNFQDSSIFEGRADYYWDFGTNDIGRDKEPSYTYTDTGYYNISLLLITKDKCIDTLTIALDSAIRIFPKPISNFTVDTLSKPLKKAVFQLDASASEFHSRSNFFVNQTFLSNQEIVSYRAIDTGHFEINHIVQNDFECADTSSAQLFVYDEFEFLIPNVFTPNNDGINDEFAVRACGVYEYEITIYNRYGAELFWSNSLNINWDGYYRGRKASPGVYFYTINIKDFKGDYISYTGTCTLIRD